MSAGIRALRGQALTAQAVKSDLPGNAAVCANYRIRRQSGRWMLDGAGRRPVQDATHHFLYQRH
jgi:hypothetical protein